jgi:mannan endo-1,4-beta-mannosidase
MKPAIAGAALALAAAILAGVCAQAGAQVSSPPPPPDALAQQPDSRDFISRADITLNQLGNPLRFGGINISWLGLLQTEATAPPRAPTTYEVDDVLDAVVHMGSGFVRSLSLGSSAGCPQCLVPTPGGKLNDAALRHLDHAIKAAHNRGIRLTIPLAGRNATCKPGDPNPVTDVACVFARARNKPDAAFFTDAGVRADFAAFVTALLNHVNTETGLQYRNDPTIMAWENCDGCGRGADPAAVAAWTEFLGQTIKAIDTHHLYANGAFAGALLAAGAARFATPSVDIVGDAITPGPDTAAKAFVPAVNAVMAANRVYVIDSYDWTPAAFPTADALWAYLTDVYAQHTEAGYPGAVTGGYVSDLSGHAETGGYLPPPAWGPPPLYFPGAPSDGLSAEDVQARGRAVRRFSYRMMDVIPAQFAVIGQPTIVSAVKGRITWRGVAGALNYSIERSQDLVEIGSWHMVCDQCVNDQHPSWQDPNVPASGPVWYRVTPYNANHHAGMSSDPARNK